MDSDSSETAGTVSSETAGTVSDETAYIAKSVLFETSDNILSDSTAAILYTSGTTGHAKGVALSHRAIARDAVASRMSVEIYGDNLLVLPLHHSYSFTAGVAVTLLSGSRICINSGIKNVLTDFKKYAPQTIFLVPLFVENFYKKIWSGAKAQKRDKTLRSLIKMSNTMLAAGIDMRPTLFKSVRRSFGGGLRLIVCGGAPLEPKYVAGFRDFGITVLNGYGITECAPVVSVNRNHHYCDGSAGLPLPGCEVTIRDPDESGLGEICVRGDTVMQGYHNNDAATDDAFADGWFRTGDIGYINDDGFVFVTGRRKNLIVLSNGKNVYPEELEAGLMEIPLVKEVVVREVSAKGHSDVVAAEIFPDHEEASSLGIDNLQGYFEKSVEEFNKQNPTYKRIRRVILRETEFEKTTTKKIKRLVN